MFPLGKKGEKKKKGEMKEKIKEKSHLKEPYTNWKLLAEAYRANPKVFYKESWFSGQIYFLVMAGLQFGAPVAPHAQSPPEPLLGASSLPSQGGALRNGD